MNKNIYIGQLNVIHKNQEVISLRKIFFMISFIIVLSTIVCDNTQAQSINKKVMYDSYLTLLDPYASKVIKKPYGLYDAKILSIERVNKGRTVDEKRINDDLFEFIVKVRYHTFTGPHNPPETYETLTFRIDPGGVKILNHISKKIK